jgi:hypothetical protein
MHVTRASRGTDGARARKQPVVGCHREQEEEEEEDYGFWLYVFYYLFLLNDNTHATLLLLPLSTVLI